MITLFLRDDDIGAWTPAAERFIATFAARGLPVAYQIIPMNLTDDCADQLRDQCARTPELIEIGQHGLAHHMMLRGRQVGYEFGRERDYGTQRAIIAEGRAILAAKLGDAFDGRMFTPPRHRFNDDTVKAARAEGFDIFSAAAYADPARRLIYAGARAMGVGSIANRGITYHPGMRPEAPMQELSIGVAVDDGPPRERRVEEVMREIDRAALHTGIVGLMFHHEAWGSKAGAAFLGDLADAIAARPDVCVALPRVIASAS